MIYLDNAATTPITKPVFEAMVPYLTEQYGNPSSLYSAGREAKKAIEVARNQIAAAINAEPEQVFFTSGATESNNWICSAFDYVLCSPIEHHSVLNHPNCHANLSYTYLESCIYDYIPDLVSHMWVNNETGKIYPITIMVQVAHESITPFMVDATQAFGHIPIDVKDLDCDFLSLSGHKFHAPKGVGILYAKDSSTLKSFHYGGQQERHLRAGTENVASIVGMGKAAELHNYNPETDLHIRALKNELMAFIKTNIPDTIINSEYECVNNILSVSFKGINAENLLLMMDSQGVCISAGSACNSESFEPSETIKALNLPNEYVGGTVRFSFSHLNTMDEIKQVENILYNTITMLRV